MKTLTMLFAGAAALIAVCGAHAAEPLKVFGLPLGGKMDAMPQICPSDTDKAKAICWVGKPYVSKEGLRLGPVHLPNADARPRWATYAGFDFTVSKDRVLQDIKVTTIDAKDKHEIASSISTRFGQPTFTNLQNTGTTSATWARPEIHIEMLCADKCYVEFRSAASQASRVKEMEARKARDAAKPVSP